MDVTAAGVSATIIVLGGGTFAATIAAIRSYERSKEPKPLPEVLSLAWVHDGLTEPPPFDRRLLIPPSWTGGGSTGAWPMVRELTGPRERFQEIIEGEVVEQLALPSKPWLGHPTIAVEALVERDIAPAVRAMVLAGAR